ncbi:MAG: CoA transferase [Actinobacteria bacterium]|nr:CoA transferase [Actinomycetota bacterium]
MTTPEALGRRIEAASSALGAAVAWDWRGELHRRGRAPRGRTTAGGAGRLVPTADGWVAVQLPRPGDVELVPAWLALASAEGSSMADAVSRASGARLAEAAELVGLAVGVLGERRPDATGGVRVLGRRPRPLRRPIRVVDLSALWAGPLCGAILAAAGCDVTKVEAVDRPDGARLGDPDLFAALNASKAHRTIDLRTELAELVRSADVVIEASRPRALAALGVHVHHGPAVWVSITGHGRASNRIAFGDDAAVAGGLVDHDADGPTFRGDALADPLSGLAAAATALELLASGEGGLVEVAMAGVAAAHAHAPQPV